MIIYDIILPEIIIACFACFILIFDLFLKKNRKWLTYSLSIGSLLIAVYFLFNLINIKKQMLFNGSFIIDNFSSISKILFCLLTGAIFIYSRKYLLTCKMFLGEFYVLCLFSLLGMMFLVSAGNLLILYLGLELLVLPLYILAAYIKENKFGLEASIKYFIMGAVASALMLYGISLVYGFTGTIDINSLYQIFSKISDVNAKNMLGIHCGVLFILAGLAFKLAASPFHMWLPDTYSGTSTPITMIIASAPKIAAIGMAYRLLSNAFLHLSNYWQSSLIIMAVLSLIIGNISALCQTNLKRMLAYSTIAHIGYVLLALNVAGQVETVNVGFNAAMYYLVIHVLSMMCAFGVIIVLSYKGYESDKIIDFKGLAYRSPILSFIMLLVLFSLAGIPPLAGFYAKFFILNALIEQGFITLSIVAIIFSVIGAYYYLKIVKFMYFDKATEVVMDNQLKGMNLSGKVLLGINGVGLLILGVYPLPIINLCKLAFI